MNYLRDYDLGQILWKLRQLDITTKQVAQDTGLHYNTLVNYTRDRNKGSPVYDLMRTVVNYALDYIPLEEVNKCVKGEKNGNERLTPAD